MDYKISQLSDKLYYIKWYRTPSAHGLSERTFIVELRKLLEAAPAPIFFISDLRQGRIMGIDTLRQLGILAKLPNWGGGTSFSEDPLTSVFVGIFTHFSKQENREDEIWQKPEDAIAYLESLKEGLTHDIDWQSILSDSAPVS